MADVKQYKNVYGKLVDITELEAIMIEAIIEEGLRTDCDVGAPIPDLQGTGGLDSMKALGGVISSLVKKHIAYILEAEEYSLGCNHVDIFKKAERAQS